LEAVKVWAHMDTDPRGHAQEPRYTFGNMLADTFAGYGARYLERTIGYRSLELIDIDRDAALVARRLAAITVQDMEANPRGKPAGRKARIAERATGKAEPWAYARKRRRVDGTQHEHGDERDEMADFARELCEPLLGEATGFEEPLDEQDLDGEIWGGLFSPEPEDERASRPQPAQAAALCPVQPWTDSERQQWLDTWRQQCYGFRFKEFGTALELEDDASSAGAAVVVAGFAAFGGPDSDPMQAPQPSSSACAHVPSPASPAAAVSAGSGAGDVGPAPVVGTPAFYRWLLSSQEPLPRGMFNSQGHWHLMIALRAMTAAGHRFVVQGSCFDLLGCDKPGAPQCILCLRHFAVASIHATAKRGMACEPVSLTLPVPLVGPQRLRPSRDYQVCGYKAHGSHQLGHFRGRVWCYACASSFAVTSARVPKAILGACAERIEEDTARRNLAFLVAGGLPPSWREEGWPKGADFGVVGFA